MVHPLKISLTAVLLTIVMWGCGVTKRIPAGQYMIDQNRIEIDRSSPGNEGVTKSVVENYIYQNANDRFLGMYFFQAIYNIPPTKSTTRLAKSIRNIGRETIILDTLSVASSALNISNYMTSSGFFNYTGDYNIEKKKKKAIVTYKLNPGEPYRIGRITYEFRDKAVSPLILEDTTSRLFQSGDIYSQRTLNNERSRITENLKNRGYYNFSVNNISYSADSSNYNHTVDIRIVVRQYVSEYSVSGEAVMENNMVYWLKEIRIVPDYDPLMTDAERATHSLDTIVYKGLRIIYSSGKENVRKQTLREAVNLHENYLYSAEQARRVYDNLLGLGYFRSASIVFTEVQDSTAAKEYVSYAGAGADSTAYGYFICTILCTPDKKYGTSAQVEGSVSSSFYAISPKLSFRNRNALGGAELFTASVWGSYEFMKSYSQESSYELGTSIGLSIPRFITPFKVDRYNKLLNTHTNIDASFIIQNRPYYKRKISEVSLSYTWNNNKHGSFRLKPVDISLVKMDYIDQLFLDSIKNEYLRNSYQSQLIPGISGSYIYNRTNGKNNTWIFKVNAETMGNLIGGLCRLFDAPTEGSDGQNYYNIFGVRFSQYVRSDISLSREVAVGDLSSIVGHIYGGFGYKYGNGYSIPYDRLFYSGGMYSMRGWMVRTLGPGNEPLPEGKTYARQVGDIKLEANLEARFPVWKIVNGAVFLDAGNVWLSKRNAETGSKGAFEFDRFYKQLGLNTGLGARIDISFIVFRVDWGIKVHNPNLVRERWIKDFQLSNTTLNFGVGYPF